LWRLGRPDGAGAHITGICIHAGHHAALRHRMIAETFFLAEDSCSSGGIYLP
jgi:hypothetical protein